MYMLYVVVCTYVYMHICTTSVCTYVADNVEPSRLGWCLEWAMAMVN